MRAFSEFCHQQISNTNKHTGIFIFVSLMERQVVVLADWGIASKLPETTWNEVVQLIISKIKIGKPTEGLISGIHRCGEILSQHFPPNGHNKNELSNRLIIKE
jgi:putative membrane protein